MKTFRTNVLVHVDANATSEQLRRIQSALKSQDGVIEAHPSSRLKNYVFVHYDPQTVDSGAILANVRRYGVEARLIGM